MTEAFNSAGIGEVLFDVLPEGKQLGGAPVNFSFHVQQLGLNAYPVSAVGRDEDGLEIVDRLENAKLPTEYIQHMDYPTGTANVSLDSYGVPNFTLAENVAWDHIQWTDKLIELATRLNAVCFGSLAQRSPDSYNSIHEFLSNTSDDCLKIFDINLRQNYYTEEIIEKSLIAANVLKLNNEELLILQDVLKLPSQTQDALSMLEERYELNCIALTRGDEGALLKSGPNYSDCPGFKTKVVDTVGAGDSYTSVLAFSLLHKLPLEQINTLANSVAAYVCSQFGASPVLPDSLIYEFANI